MESYRIYSVTKGWHAWMYADLIVISIMEEVEIMVWEAYIDHSGYDEICNIWYISANNLTTQYDSTWSCFNTLNLVWNGLNTSIYDKCLAAISKSTITYNHPFDMANIWTSFPTSHIYPPVFLLHGTFSLNEAFQCPYFSLPLLISSL